MHDVSCESFQIGCFVPAKAATFRIANGIFSRLGSDDNIEGHESTFAVEAGFFHQIKAVSKLIMPTVNSQCYVFSGE